MLHHKQQCQNRRSDGERIRIVQPVPVNLKHHTQEIRMEMNIRLPDNAGELMECPGDAKCVAQKGPYGMTYAHVHCAIDGCVMHAEGGGGDDGRGIGGYDNATTFDGELVNIKCLDTLSGIPTWGDRVTVSDAHGTVIHVKRGSDNVINDIKVRFDNGRELWFPPATFRPGIGGEA
jgi:hypothetical protein